MELKRIVAPDMRTALKILREELGPDAIILSNKKVAQGVEIVSVMEMPEIDPAQVQTLQIDKMPFPAAVPAESAVESRYLEQLWSDNSHHPETPEPSGLRLVTESSRVDDEFDDPEMNSHHAGSPGTYTPHGLPDASVGSESVRQADSPARQIPDGQPNTERQDISTRGRYRSRMHVSVPEVTGAGIPRLTAEIPSHREADLQALQAELRSMRDLLQQQLGSFGWQQLVARNPIEATLWRRMDQMGLPPAIAKSCLPTLDQQTSLDSAWRFTLGNLVNQIGTTGDIAADGGVYALVGPTGAGKTLTISKLAAKYVLMHGADKVAILTMDTGRIGAYEQLRIIGRILHVPVRVVENYQHLDKTLRSLSDKSLILIDTAGLAWQDPRAREQIECLARLEASVQSYLVIAANSQLETMEAAYQLYGQAQIKGCILTRLDETCSLGAALGLLAQHRLKLAYVTDGQEIPDDIKPAYAVDLVSKGVSMMRRKGALGAVSDLVEQVPTLWMNRTVMNESAEMAVGH